MGGSMFPAVTGEQMAEVDRIMIRELGVNVLQLMELAGRAVASFARDRMLAGNADGTRVVILCGTGGNGGDGMVAARLLHAWGAEVEVWLSHRPDPDRGVAAHQLAILERMAISIVETPANVEPVLPSADLTIDGLLGFSLAGPPSGTTAALIRAANTGSSPVLAIDLPSGLTATAGEVLDPCIRAAATLTLALPKRGLFSEAATAVTGRVWSADIGVPPEIYRRFGLEIGPLYARRAVISADSVATNGM
ncbi:MAG: NAD(P)H-hydrate epimerase [Thermomicrobiales bacterium]|nr:NAD(P)H-hydrate epimerase [Thermomicrobiales bacterium]